MELGLCESSADLLHINRGIYAGGARAAPVQCPPSIANDLFYFRTCGFRK